MITVTNEVIREGKESMTCLECHGTGIVCHWSEFAFFDDRRYCGLCDAGRRVENTVIDIIKRAESDDYSDSSPRLQR